MDLSKFIPRQVQLPYVGAIFDLVCKAFAIMGGVNFLMLTRSTFYNSSDSLLRDTFGSYTVFMLTVSIAGIVVLMLVYVFLVPSYNAHTQRQAVIEGRSPMYEKICEINERLKKLEEKL